MFEFEKTVNFDDCLCVLYLCILDNIYMDADVSVIATGPSVALASNN